MNPSPSAEQRATFERGDPSRPVVLFYECTGGDPVAALAAAAASHGARLLWTGTEEQVLVGRCERFDRAAQFQSRTRRGALACVDDPAHARAARMPRGAGERGVGAAAGRGR